MKSPKKIPNFLIVGAAKAGTTSFYHWLKEHPEVFMPNIKEPSFFVHNYGISNGKEYLSLFRLVGKQKAIGESSTAYLCSPESPQLIHDYLGNIKIIIFLRNPEDRAYSLYSWMVMEGYENIIPFERALQEEEKRFYDQDFRFNNQQFFWDFMYTKSGFYYEQVKRYIDLFGNENVKTIVFEELINTPEKIYYDVCNFLNISNDYKPDFIHLNKTKVPKNIRLNYHLHSLIRKLNNKRSIRFLFFFLIQLLYLIIYLNLKSKDKKHTELSENIRIEMNNAYKKDLVQLSKLIKKDLTHWIN